MRYGTTVINSYCIIIIYKHDRLTVLAKSIVSDTAGPGSLFPEAEDLSLDLPPKIGVKSVLKSLTTCFGFVWD